MLSYAEKLRWILFYPKSFFKEVEDETDYLKPLLFFAILYIIVSVFGLVLDSITTFIFGGAMEIFSHLIFIPVSLVLIGIIAFTAPFVSAAITSLGLMILKVKVDFQKTFKVVAYASVVGLFYSLIYHIVFFLFSFIFPGIAVATQSFTISGILIVSFLVLSILFFVVSFIHVVVTEVIGLVHEYQITKLRAFFSIILVPLLTLAFLFLIGIILLIVIVVISQYAFADSSFFTGMITSAIP